MEVLTSYLQNCIILLMVDFSVLHARALALRPRCDPLPSFRELEECENITQGGLAARSGTEFR